MSERAAPTRLTEALEGRYRLERELGEGGMATVYLAEDIRHARQVAIKVLKPELAASVGADRFLREIRTTANLRHPNIVPLYDSGEAGGFLYYVMPYVEGESLRDRLRRETQLPVEEALRLTREVAEALGSAHARGVVHRDIKPGNVMLEAGHAVVTDFGIASAVSVAGGARLTQTGMMVGTPAYMSPEQGMGQGEADARSDLYSLACVLYEMLAGTPPFTGPTAAVVIARHTLDAPPPLSTARPGLAGHIAAAVERALSKTPADRFETAERWIEALTSAPADGGTSGGARHTAGAAAGTHDLALSVLRFQAPEDPAMRALAEGLAEDITAGLTLFPHLVLVPATTRVADTDMRLVAERLGVRYVLRGQLRRSGDAVRLSVQVVDALRGQHIWSERHDRDLSTGGAFEIQDDLVERVVATVADGFGALGRAMCATLEGKDEDRFTAAEWVLRHYDYLQRITPDEHARFRDSLERAVEREPRRSEIQACLSIVYLHEEGFGFNKRPGALDRALTAARRAVDLDRTSQLGYQMLAQSHFFRRDQGAFRLAAERAMALNPRDSNTLAILGLQLVHIGDYERGADICRRAMAINPHHAGWYHFGPLWEHFHGGEYEKALARANQVNMPGQFWQPLAIAACNAHLGRQRQAEAAIRDLLAIDPDFGRHARRNIESWHYASGLLEPLIEGLVKAGLDIPEEGAGRPADERHTAGPPAGPPAEAVAIAVLPFADMSPGRNQEYFCEGMAEEIMNALVQVGGIRVASRHSAFRARSEDRDLRSIGRLLSVNQVLEGSVRAAGGRLRVTAQLIDVHEDRQLWSERFDRQAEDVFAVQDEIAAGVVEAVRTHLVDEGVEIGPRDVAAVRPRAPIADLEAYHHYLQGRFFRYTKLDLKASAKAYQAALAREPSYGLAHLGLAEAFAVAHAYGFEPPAATYGPAERELAAARDSLGETAEGLAIAGWLAWIHDWDTDAAASLLERAIERDPHSVVAHAWRACLLATRGDAAALDPGLEALERLDSVSPYGLAMTAAAYLLAGRVEESLERGRAAIDAEPGSLLAHWVYGSAQGAAGQVEAAAETMGRAVALSSRGSYYLGMYAWAQAAAGRDAEARDTLRELVERAEREYVPPIMIAWGFGELGDREWTRVWLEQAFEERTPILSWGRFPVFRGLYGEPEMADLLRHLRGTAAAADPSPTAGPVAAESPSGESPSAESPSAESPSAEPPTTGADVRRPSGTPRSLAVLPLANLSGDPGQEFFVAGMHEAILTELARIGALTVISRTSVLRFKDTEEPLPDVARQLGVETVIEGSVLRAGDRVRIALQLIQASPEKHLWAESYERDLTDVLALHAEVARAVAGAVSARLTPDEEEKLAQAAAVDPEVYDLYLRGSYLNQWVTEEARRAVEYLERVVERAPDFAPAHAGLARRYTWLSSLGVEPGIGVLARAAAAAERAHELDPDSGEALAMVGYIQFVKDWDAEGARRKLARAMELEPGNVNILLDAAFHLAILGEWEGADRILVRALELDPFNAQAAFTRGWARMMARRYEEAIQILEAAYELHPTLAYIPQWTAFCYAKLGQADRGLEWARVADRCDPDSVILDFLAVLGQVYAMAGEEGEARRIQARVESLAAGEGGAWFRWTIPLALGELDTAYEGLVQAFEERNPFLVLLPVHPIFDPARAEPRMAKLIQDMNLIPGLVLPAARESADEESAAPPGAASETPA